MLADAHLHLFARGYAGRYSPAFARRDEPALYDAMRREHGVVRALVVGFEGRLRGAGNQGLPPVRGNNRDLARWRATRPWMAPLAFHRPHAPPTPAALAAARRAGFVGIALYPRADEVDALAAWPEATLARLRALGCVVSVNAASPQLPALARFLRRLEGCSPLISHLGLPPAQRVAPGRAAAGRLTADLRALAALPHVGVKLSGLYALSDPPHDYPHRAAWPLIARVRDAFGPRRLFWGSDFSPALAHVSFAQAIDAVALLGWSRGERGAVMGGNLLRALARAEAAR